MGCACYCIIYFNTKMSDTRQVIVCSHRFSRDRCVACGQFNYAAEAVKTSKYASPFHFNLHHYLKSLRRSASKVLQPRQINEETYQLLTAIADKFLFTQETLALALYLFQLLHRLHPSEKFWASAALIVAAKAVELDKNVPYLNRYQRYADKGYSQQDYEQAERTIFEALNYEVQHATFVTFLDFYLTCGVLFKEDGLNNTLVEFFEDDIAARARDFLRRGTFTKYDPELLALGIVKEVRHKYNLRSWNRHLEQLSGFSEDEIMAISSHESPLREISSNQVRLGELKGAGVRKKYENLINKPALALDKYSSASKSTTLKENSYSTSKLLVPSNSRKPSHNFLNEGLTALNCELLSKRR